MMISSKGRYALRVMIDLAEHADEGYIPLQTIAARQGISEKYLESILAVLSKARLLDAVRGKGGGYRLSRPAKDYTAFEILSLTEGTLAVGTEVSASIDLARRGAIARSHTATHMVHKALREELGPQATQRGSEDAPYRLRFDFPTDAGILNYLREREFIADEVPFRRKYFG